MRSWWPGWVAVGGWIFVLSGRPRPGGSLDMRAFQA